jgi:hypothetical protein
MSLEVLAGCGLPCMFFQIERRPESNLSPTKRLATNNVSSVAGQFVTRLTPRTVKLTSMKASATSHKPTPLSTLKTPMEPAHSHLLRMPKPEQVIRIAMTAPVILDAL